MPPIAYGLSSGKRAFAEQSFDDGCAETFRHRSQLPAGVECALAGQDDRLLRRVQDFRGSSQAGVRRERRLPTHRVRNVMGDIALGADVFRDRFVLNIDRDRHMRHAAERQAVRHASSTTFSMWAAPMTRVL